MLFKRDGRINLVGYRPINLLCHISNLIMKVPKNRKKGVTLTIELISGELVIMFTLGTFVVTFAGCSVQSTTPTVVLHLGFAFT